MSSNVAKTFAEVEAHPRWKELPIARQTAIRNDWVALKLTATPQAGDETVKRRLMEEAFLNAPEFTKPPEIMKGEFAPSFTTKHPSLSALLNTALGATTSVFGAPQQLVANLIDPLIKGEKPAGVKEALIQPFQRTGEWMIGERERTKLPADPLTSELTDPLTVVPIAKGVQAIGKGAQAVKKMGRGALSMEELKKFSEEVNKNILTLPTKVKDRMGSGFLTEAKGIVSEIPRSWATMGPEQKILYKDVISAGQRYLPKEELQVIAETIANSTKQEAAQALRILQEGNLTKINSLKAWANRAQWKRGKLGEKAKSTPTSQPAPSTTNPVEDLTDPSTGGYLNYLNKMMEPPTL